MNFTNPILEIDNEFKNYDPKDFDLFNEFDKNKILKFSKKMMIIMMTFIQKR